MNKRLIRIILVLGSLDMVQIVEASPRERLTQRVLRSTSVVQDVYGSAQQRKGASNAWTKINGGDILTTETTVKTGDSSAVLLKLSGGHMFRIGENTTVELKELGRNKSFSFHVLAGNIWSVVRKATQPAKYEVETPSVVAGVSGTLFAVFHDASISQTTVSTNLGQVNVQQLGALGQPGGPGTPVGAGQYIQMGRSVRNSTGVPPPSLKVLRQPPAFRQMWVMMRREGWTLPAAAGKLDPTIDTDLRRTVFRRRRPMPGAPVHGDVRPNGRGSRRKP